MQSHTIPMRIADIFSLAFISFVRFARLYPGMVLFTVLVGFAEFFVFGVLPAHFWSAPEQWPTWFGFVERRREIPVILLTAPVAIALCRYVIFNDVHCRYSFGHRGFWPVAFALEVLEELVPIMGRLAGIAWGVVAQAVGSLQVGFVAAVVVTIILALFWTRLSLVIPAAAAGGSFPWRTVHPITRRYLAKLFVAYLLIALPLHAFIVIANHLVTATSVTDWTVMTVFAVALPLGMLLSFVWISAAAHVTRLLGLRADEAF